MILKILSYLFIIYLVFRLIGFVFKSLFMVMGKRAFERAHQNQARSNGRSGRAPEGSVRIEHVPPRDKKQPADFQGGEYVDYEEIKDKKNV